MTKSAKPNLDLLITGLEPNAHHGVGIFLNRLFPLLDGFVSLRSTSLYAGQQVFGAHHHELISRNLTAAETTDALRSLLEPYSIRRILCVPYYREDFIHGLLAQQMTGAPLCTFLMDDQNIFAPHVADHRVAELLAVSDLVLGISPEMCAAYGKKYGQPVHLMPPVLTQATDHIPCYWDPIPGEPLRCAMIGNVWTAQRFVQLRELLRATGLHVDWYGNGPKATWLQGTPEEWEADHIRCLGYLPEDDLIASLAAYPFVVVPSGSLDHQDDNPAFSRLSLPSRLLFLHANTDTPVLVLGSSETAAGRFVQRVGTGLCACYDTKDLARSLERLSDPVLHTKLRQAVRNCAKHLVMPDAGQWLWESLASRRPVTAPFHKIFAPLDPMQENWLGGVTKAKTKPVRRLPTADLLKLEDEQTKGFAYLRKYHLALLAQTGIALPPAENIELTQLILSSVQYLTQRLLFGKARLLYLGDYIPEWIARLPADLECWRIGNLADWVQDGFSDAPHHVVRVSDGAIFDRSVMDFDAIVSTNWLDQVKTPEALGIVAQFLSSHTRRGGINLHGFTAVLHPSYFWTGPAHQFLRNHWQIEDWPDLDEILSDDDLFTMSESAYATYWQPSVGKPFRAFGKPLGLLLFWRHSKRSPMPAVR